MANRERCNICGISEHEIHDGVCHYCPGENVYCTMDASEYIEKRVYDYAHKHNLLSYYKMPTFNPENIRTRFEKISVRKGVPKYFLEAISCDGLTFSSLNDFPVGDVFRVCRGSSDPAFLQVGDLVYRTQETGGNMDGLNVIQGAGAWDREESESALKGAHFEKTYYFCPGQ